MPSTHTYGTQPSLFDYFNCLLFPGRAHGPILVPISTTEQYLSLAHCSVSGDLCSWAGGDVFCGITALMVKVAWTSRKQTEVRCRALFSQAGGEVRASLCAYWRCVLLRFSGAHKAFTLHQGQPCRCHLTSLCHLCPAHERRNMVDVG